VLIAIVSDIHGNLVALEAVIADLDREAPDLIVHGGDLSVIGPRPAEVIDLIRDKGWPGVLGNTDELIVDASTRAEQERKAPKLRDWLEVLYGTLGPWARSRLRDEQISWLAGLPREWRREGVVLFHAAPRDLWRAPREEASDDELRETYGDLNARLAVYGHIHRPFVRRLDGLTVANSGSDGLPYDGDWRPSYLLVDAGVPVVRRVEYDLERAALDAMEGEFPLPGWLAEVQHEGRFHPPG
jgi:predicted phosphodiesterase